MYRDGVRDSSVDFITFLKKTSIATGSMIKKKKNAKSGTMIVSVKNNENFNLKHSKSKIV